MRRTQKSPETTTESDAEGLETGPDAPTAPETPFFSHEIDQAALNRRREIAVRIAPNEAERAAIAEHLNLVSLSALLLEGALQPHGAHGWRLEGALSAMLEQRCVATLDPAPEEIDEPIERIWLPAEEVAKLEAEALEAGLDPDDIDLDAEEPEALPERLDLGPVALEALALALDPYPRAPGADFNDAVAGPPGIAPMTDADVRPFAGLAALKAQLETGDSASKNGSESDDEES